MVTLYTKSKLLEMPRVFFGSFGRSDSAPAFPPYLFISSKLAPSDTNGFPLSFLRLDALSYTPPPSSSHQESRLQGNSVIVGNVGCEGVNGFVPEAEKVITYYH